MGVVVLGSLLDSVSVSAKQPTGNESAGTTQGIRIGKNETGSPPTLSQTVLPARESVFRVSRRQIHPQSAPHPSFSNPQQDCETVRDAIHAARLSETRFMLRDVIRAARRDSCSRKERSAELA